MPICKRWFLLLFCLVHTHSEGNGVHCSDSYGTLHAQEFHLPPPPL